MAALLLGQDTCFPSWSPTLSCVLIFCRKETPPKNWDMFLMWVMQADHQEWREIIAFGAVINFRNVLESATCLSVMSMLCGFLGWHLRDADLDSTFGKYKLPQVLSFFLEKWL